MASGRTHLSIGDVLSLVQAEFPDITISKIRFLESQGLLEPERTPSGYRKFYDQDIERLRWILAQQRDHFLPLKVIRERLQEWDESGEPPSGGVAVHPSGHVARRDAARVEEDLTPDDSAPDDPAHDDPVQDDTSSDDTRQDDPPRDDPGQADQAQDDLIDDESAPDGRSDSTAYGEEVAPDTVEEPHPTLIEAADDTAPAHGDHDAAPADSAPDHEPSEPDSGTEQRGAGPDRGMSADPSTIDARAAASLLAAGSAMEVAPTPEPRRDDEADHDEVDHGVAAGAATARAADATPDVASPRGSTAPRSGRTRRDWHPVAGDDEAMTAAELAEQAGIAVQVVEDLEGFSMIRSTRVGPDVYYDASALRVATACRAFLDHGIEVRHLRMYKIAAEREAGMFEQLVMPLLKQRNPTAKAKAVETVAALADVGEELHAALLRAALTETLG